MADRANLGLLDMSDIAPSTRGHSNAVFVTENADLYGDFLTQPAFPRVIYGTLSSWQGRSTGGEDRVGKVRASFCCGGLQFKWKRGGGGGGEQVCCHRLFARGFALFASPGRVTAFPLPQQGEATFRMVFNCNSHFHGSVFFVIRAYAVFLSADRSVGPQAPVSAPMFVTCPLACPSRQAQSLFLLLATVVIAVTNPRISRKKFFLPRRGALPDQAVIRVESGETHPIRVLSKFAGGTSRKQTSHPMPVPMPLRRPVSGETRLPLPPSAVAQAVHARQTGAAVPRAGSGGGAAAAAAIAVASETQSPEGANANGKKSSQAVASGAGAGGTPPGGTPTSSRKRKAAGESHTFSCCAGGVVSWTAWFDTPGL